MFAALNKADGVAKLLIDANAHMDATDKVVRPLGTQMYTCMGSGWLASGPARPSPRSSHECTQLYPASPPAK